MSNNNWYSCSIGDIEKKLNTNAASGLSRKAARSRYTKGGANSLFRIKRMSYFACLKQIFIEPLTLILYAVLILAIAFGMKSIAFPALFILLLNASMSAVAYIKSDRICEATARYSRPLARVIRSGKLYYVDSVTVVRGDILILRTGDIVACDVRLISSEGLCVLSPEGPDDTLSKIEKNADAVYPEGEFVPVEKRDNCVCGGSEVLMGSARAVAVETGRHTYLGAKRGGFELRPENTETESGKYIRRFCSKYSLIMLILMLPLTIVGLYLGGESVSLYSSIVTAFALAVSGMGEQLSPLISVALSFLISAASLSDPSENAAIIKNPQSAEAVSSLTDLFIMERAALSDGKPKFAAVYACGRTYYSDKIKKEYPHYFFESAFLFGTGCLRELSRNPEISNRLLEVMNRVISDSDYDNKATEIVYGDFTCSESFNGKYCHCVTASSRENTRTILMLEGSELIGRCTHYRGIDGGIYAIDVARDGIYDAVRLFCDSACDTVTYASVQGSRIVFEGVAAFRESYCNKTSEYVSRLNACGIEVRCFMRRESKENTAYLLNSGFVDSVGSIAFASEFAAHGRNISVNYGKYKAYLGFSQKQIIALMSFLSERGKKIAVLGLSSSEIPVLDRADVAFACDSTAYRTSRINEVLLDSMGDDGQVSGLRAAQNVRMRSDIIVRRASRCGGGLGGVLRALSSSYSVTGNLCVASSYLVFSQMLRIIIVLVSSVLGIALLSPVHLLFGGLIFDFLCVLAVCLLRFEYSDGLAPAPDVLKNPIRSNIPSIAAGIVSGTVILAVSLYKFLSGSASGAQISSFAFACVLSCCAVILLCSVMREKKRAGRSANKKVYVRVCSAAAAMILLPQLMSLVPALNTLLGTEFMGFGLLMWSLLPPTATFAAYFISPDRRMRSKQ